MKFRPDNKIFTRLYRCFLYRFAGGVVLLLTTTGRRSGRPHTIGLQYELIDGAYWVGAADGPRADWYRNLLVNPQVEIQAGRTRMSATAAVVDDPERVAEYLAYRLKKRPLMLRLILWLDGNRGRITVQVLRDYAKGIRAVVITPVAAIR